MTHPSPSAARIAGPWPLRLPGGCSCDTNTIEGGTLAEEETTQALAFDPGHVRETEERRVLNLKAAYDLSKRVASTPSWSFFRVPTALKMLDQGR